MVVKMNRKGQVTIFIIAGVAIVVGIILFFVFRANVIPTYEVSPEKNPSGFLSSCIEDRLEEKIKLIYARGGNVETTLYTTLDDENITYLCYTQNYYVSCVNQVPLLIQHLKKEIKEKINPDVEDCFQLLKSNLENSNYDVNLGPMDFEVVLQPGKVTLEIDRDMDINLNGQSTKFENYRIGKVSRIYDLAVIVQEIVSQEAEYCNFENVGFMILYSDYNIDKFRKGDGSLIYTVEYKKTGEKFKFAVRGCVYPGGI